MEPFNPFSSKESAIAGYAKKVEQHFALLTEQIQTRMPEVDIKRWEARQCVAFELGISAIVMTCVALEEFLKCLLKYNYFKNTLDRDSKSGLEELESASVGAEDAFGTFKLHNAIQKARKEISSHRRKKQD